MKGGLVYCLVFLLLRLCLLWLFCLWLLFCLLLFLLLRAFLLLRFFLLWLWLAYGRLWFCLWKMRLDDRNCR